MLKENCIKILGTGLSYIKTAYKNVILDIDQAEKEQKADSYTFSAEGFIPNSAEKYNLSLHKEGLEGKTVHIEHAAGGTNRNISNKDIKIIDNISKSISIER